MYSLICRELQRSSKAGPRAPPLLRPLGLCCTRSRRNCSDYPACSGTYAEDMVLLLVLDIIVGTARITSSLQHVDES